VFINASSISSNIIKSNYKGILLRIDKEGKIKAKGRRQKAKKEVIYANVIKRNTLEQ